MLNAIRQKKWRKSTGAKVFCTKVLCTAFMYLEFVFVLCKNEIVKKSALKMLAKLKTILFKIILQGKGNF